MQIRERRGLAREILSGSRRSTEMGSTRTSFRDGRDAATASDIEAGAYEIHCGRTVSRLSPFAMLSGGAADGAVLDRVMGTYLRGVQEHPRLARGLFGGDSIESGAVDPYDRLAERFEGNENIPLFEEQYL